MHLKLFKMCFVCTFIILHLWATHHNTASMFKKNKKKMFLSLGFFLGACVCFRSGHSSSLQSFLFGSLAVKLISLCSSPRQVQDTYPYPSKRTNGVKPAGYNNQKIWTVLWRFIMVRIRFHLVIETEIMRRNNEQEVRVIHGQCCFLALHLFKYGRSEGSSNKCRRTNTPSFLVSHTWKQTLRAPQPSGIN